MRFTVKLGGSLLEDAAVRRAILSEVATLQGAGHEVVLVHGGGKRLTRRLGQLGIESRFVDGLRVTDGATLEVAVMVLAGELNKGIVVELEGMGVTAVGICGADAHAVSSVPLETGARDSLGWVGRASAVNRSFFDLLLGGRAVPVVSSLALGSDHRLYNVNADQMAAACAWGTGADALIYLTDVAGVKGEDGAVLRSLRRRDIERLRERGVISGGMLPKTASCLEALERDVGAVYIAPGASQQVLLRVAAGTYDEGSVIHGDERGHRDKAE